MTALGGSETPDVLIRFGAMFGPMVSSGEYWRLITAMFIHIGFSHVLFNGFSLFIFGRLSESYFGPSRFITIYLLAGFLGSVASYTLNPMAISAGASGAIFGILGSLAAYYLVQKKDFGKIAQGNLTGILILAAINLAYGLATPRIDNWAHLSGFISGFTIGYVLSPRYKISVSEIGITKLTDSNSLMKSIWIVPAAIITATVVLAIANPSNETHLYSQITSAEKYYRENRYDQALDELNTILSAHKYSLDSQAGTLIAEAHLLRGIIYVETGDLESAITDLSLAIRWGDTTTKAAANEILVAINFKG